MHAAHRDTLAHGRRGTRSVADRGGRRVGSRPIDTSLRLQELRHAAGSTADFFSWEVLGAWTADAPAAHVEELVTYVAEASFFWSVLEAEVRALPADANVLEIGAGIGLFSMLLSSLGATVVAYEPESAGFNLMDDFATLLQTAWIGPPTKVERLRAGFTPQTTDSRRFDMAVAINVIEHLPNPADVVAAATRLLTPTGHGYFICPNYTFPYEPHFGIPTLVSKRWTERVFRSRIASSKIHDSEQFWAELSWPTVGTLGAALRARGIEFRFSDQVLLGYLRRLDDPLFVERKGTAFRFIARTGRKPAEWAIRALPRRLSPSILLITHGAPAA